MPAGAHPKVTIITGASRGIEPSLALACGRHGSAVSVNYRIHEAAARGVVAEIERGGGVALAVEVDVSRQDDVDDLVAATIGRFGRADEIWPAVRMMIETEYLMGQPIAINAGRFMT